MIDKLWHRPYRRSAHNVLAAFLLVVPMAVGAHGDAQWIQDEAWRSPTSNIGCCGPGDCKVVDKASVRLRGSTYLVKSPFAHGAVWRVPANQVLPSIDNHFWLCEGKKVVGDEWVEYPRCFFGPLTGS